jgi:hypothetical protein
LKVVDYGDEFTRKALGNKFERTFAMIKPCSVKKIGAIIHTI